MHRFTFVCTFLWILKASNAIRMTVREGSTKELWCNGEMVLDIYFAKYEGRAIYCGRNEVTTSVQQQCNGLTSCQVSAKDEIYDDSCAFSNEVLTIRYGCVDSTLSTRTQDTTGSTTDHNRWHSSTTENDRRLSTVTDDTSLENTTSIEPRESALTNNHTRETITIATLIGGCIFGLLLIAVITITIFRHFRETKDIDAGDNVEILHINALSGSELDHHDHGSDRIDYVAETHLTNRDILSNNSSTLLSMAYKNNSYTLEPTAVRNVSKTLKSRNLTEDTRCKYTDDSEYSVIQNYSGDILPPSYDVLRECSSPTCLADCANKYNHANYNGNSYDKTNRSTPIKWSGDHNDGYSTAATFLLESDQCSPDNDSSEHVYENQQINYKDNKSLNHHKTSRQFGADYLSAEKEGMNTPTKKCNPYDNMNFTKSSRAAKTSKKKIPNYQNIGDNFSPTANYINVSESLSMENQAEDPNSHYSSPINRASSSQNVQNSEQNNNGQSQCYMPMNFGISKKKTDFVESDNVYVPIMSPTTLVSPSDVFDDTYQF
ncbi:uncharacterized protein LOC127707427 isoform X1 [Mytilus californianus]|uniref:uncharacterized protein LOC127707427 isoform X1 n=1 Tax=Mytilus californianus TaxID=6549 RepID=UPI002245FDF4|nr:uncharacterized protein LOC127707427 isoform X1 [Mytilus californianus]